MKMDVCIKGVGCDIVSIPHLEKMPYTRSISHESRLALAFAAV